MNSTSEITTCNAFDLIHALMQGGKSIEARLDAALADVGLSSAKWSVLKHLVEAGEPLPLGQLAAKSACVKSNMTQLVDRLEADHLVRRSPDPEDRRSIRAELTQKGRECYDLGRVIVHEFEHDMLRDFSQEEHLLLRRVLTRLGDGRVESGERRVEKTPTGVSS